MAKITKILHATDFSANSDEAYKVARQLAEDLDSTLIILTVVSGGEQTAASAITGWLPFVDTLRGNMQAKYCEALSCPHEILIRKGSPATTIVSTAEEEQVDLIVIGARGAGTLQRLLGEGSVADKVLRTSSLPVVVVPRV